MHNVISNWRATDRHIPGARALRLWHPLLLAALAAGLAACGELEVRDSAPDQPYNMPLPDDPQPRHEPMSRYGNPESYAVDGQRYFVMKTAVGHRERGIASWYGTKFHGRRTSSGEPYDMHAMTAAHKTLPLPIYVEVTRTDTGQSIVVRVNDRGPFREGRIIDLSYAAARKLGIDRTGTAPVEIRVVTPAEPQPLQAVAPAASDDGGNRSIYLQVGAFSNPDNAQRLASTLLNHTRQAVHINPLNTGTATLYRVRIGPFPSEDDASRISHQLTPLSLDSTHLVVE